MEVTVLDLIDLTAGCESVTAGPLFFCTDCGRPVSEQETPNPQSDGFAVLAYAASLGGGSPLDDSPRAAALFSFDSRRIVR